MKKLAILFSTSILSAIIAIVIFSHFHEPRTIIIEHERPSVFVANNPGENERSLEPTPAGTPLNFTSAALTSRKSIVFIRGFETRESDSFGQQYRSASGSGVVISSDGYIVTNFHVIKDADDLKVTLNNKKEYDAKIVGTDPTSDIALIKINGTDLAHLEFGNSDKLNIGEWVLAIGNPFRLQSSVTAGIVSAKARRINILESMTGIESFIQTDAAVNPGNSGGALINTKGELIGINTAIMTNSGGYEGFSFAIPANLVKKVVTDLKDYGAVQRGWLGVTITDVDSDQAEKLKLEYVKGVYISSVNANSAAFDGGLKEGDIIMGIDQIETVSTPEFMEQIAQFRPGDQVQIQYIRDRERFSANVILRNQLNTTDFIALRKDKILTDLGFELRNLDSGEKRNLSSLGAKVITIYQNSIIDQTKMEPGYIITSVNEKAVDTVEELIDAISSAESEVVLNGFYENHPGEYPYRFKK
jgi:Do/DeqQ family serine protease